MKIISAVEAPLKIALSTHIPSITGLKAVLKSDLIYTPNRKFLNFPVHLDSPDSVTVDFSGFETSSSDFMDNIGQLTILHDGGQLFSCLFICDNGESSRVKIAFDKNDDLFVNKLASN